MCWWLAPQSSGVLHTVPSGWAFLLRHPSHILNHHLLSRNLFVLLPIPHHLSTQTRFFPLPHHYLSTQTRFLYFLIIIYPLRPGFFWVLIIIYPLGLNFFMSPWGLPSTSHLYQYALQFLLLNGISTVHPTAVSLLWWLEVVLSNSISLLECNLLFSSLLRLSFLNRWTRSTSFASNAMSPLPNGVGSKP